jgi:hypothetical protein
MYREALLLSRLHGQATHARAIRASVTLGERASPKDLTTYQKRSGFPSSNTCNTMVPPSLALARILQGEDYERLGLGVTW